MKLSPDEIALSTFWRFIAKRQQAFTRRALGMPPPWTDDPVIRDNHFTNVYRELDPGTRWLVDNVLSREELSKSDRAFLTFAYRLFGTEEVFEVLGARKALPGHPLLPDTYKERYVADTLQDLMDTGVQAFTPAYMVSNYGIRKPKSQVIAGVLAKAAEGWPHYWDLVEQAVSREHVHQQLMGVYGAGRFVAFQVMVDLCYPLPMLKGDKILHFSNNDWVAAGPGAVKGLSILYPEVKEADWRKGLDNRTIASLVSTQYTNLAAHGMRWLVDLKNKPILIDRSNMQNCLCEFSKYVRLRKSPRSGGRKRKFSEEAASKRDYHTPHDYSLVGMAVQTDISDALL